LCFQTIHGKLNQKQSQYMKIEEEAASARKNYDQEVAKGMYAFHRIQSGLLIPGEQ